MFTTDPQAIRVDDDDKLLPGNAETQAAIERKYLAKLRLALGVLMELQAPSKDA
jgi:hypothetical protein